MKRYENKFIAQPLAPKTETKIVLEQEQSKLTPEQEEQLRIEESYYNEFESYGGIGISKGYGPCLTYNSNCRCSLEELQRQRLILENREIEERINRANNQNIEENNVRQNEELQRLRNEFADLQVSYNDLQGQTNTLIQERNNAVEERDDSQGRLNEANNNINNLNQQNNNLQTNLANAQNARQTAEQQRNQAITERNGRPNISQVNYNNLTRERDNLRQQNTDLTNELGQRPDLEEYNRLVNENQELKNQQITELALDIRLNKHEKPFEDNFKKIEKIKSLKKLFIYVRGHPGDYNVYLSSLDEWSTRLQNFIDQNANLTHLEINHDSNWPIERSFDFSKLTKLIFLSIPSPHQKDLDLRENKELEFLFLFKSPNGIPKLNNLRLKESKKLKCLIFCGKNGINSLNLSKNKDLEYIDITETEISHLDLDKNEKITRLDEKDDRDIKNWWTYQGQWANRSPWEVINYESGVASCRGKAKNIYDSSWWKEQVVRLA